ncbi:hypothetical protein TPHA_0E03150 [Tetrapisispora phaffii CBS 4417]|uniref:Cytochrome b mRNA-processing protein 4 n=1 Tax=Tetrapisispora phaffii (strain ATCC 24235 / CBS 4417 / NBRC 1672 / NRRL Y-8282 / UCD 70-5) TaxID=1071381 RepID=G8BU27_TETPH|nr:hypothetical protein TPHA_0E03150 [Tetrapisispora phaffii CBS 4417]CCE63405.1 hypothetical protein TPHA_0E03150 [Tetrapisispora phaffii CBS 4417]
MDTPLWLRWAKVYAAGGVIIGTGLLLFKYVTPTDEQLLNSFSPEVRLEYEQQKKLREAEQQELMKVVQQTSTSNDPIWKTGSIVSPWERADEGKNDPNQRYAFQKLKSSEVQKDELKKIRDELQQLRVQSEAKTNQIVQEKMKNWWKFW